MPGIADLAACWSGYPFQAHCKSQTNKGAPLLLVAWVGHLFMADVGICQRRRLVWSLGRDLEDDATAVSALDAASGRAVEFITGVTEDRRAEGVLA
jgi:hypothetical protein